MNQVSKISETAEKKCKIAIWIITAAVLVLVGMMRRPEFHISLPEGVSLDFLPLVHAIINSLVALCLIFALVSIKQGNINRHKALMTSAMVLSLLFLLCYVAYHFTSEETRFGGVGTIRTVYLLL